MRGWVGLSCTSRFRSPCRPLWGTPHDGESVHASLPVGLRYLACPRGRGEGRRPAPRPPRPCPTAAWTSAAPMVGVDALLQVCRPCPPHWADPPIQNRRSRRCGGGLEPVPLQHSSPVRPAGSA